MHLYGKHWQVGHGHPGWVGDNHELCQGDDTNDSDHINMCMQISSLSESKVKEGCPCSSVLFLTHNAASCASDSIEALSDHNHNVHHSIPESPAVLSGK